MINGQLTLATRARSTPTADIIAAYRETGSVWKAGKLLGIAGQSVHERLRKIGHPMANRTWTPEECDELRALIAEDLTFTEISQRLGRPFAGIACKASELGLKRPRLPGKNGPRERAIPKTAALRHMKAVEAYDGKVTHYARANGLDIESLVQAFQAHCADRWTGYVASHSHLPSKTCPYCEQIFIPMLGKQLYCSRRCGMQHRQDQNYFGGKRRTHTQGLETGLCQLCEQPDTHLSSHHILGKANDPDNDSLIALCRGCHKLVSLLASRPFVDDQDAWEKLIQLAHFRAHGAEIAAGDFEDYTVLHVTVDIDTYVDEYARDLAAEEAS